MDKELDKYYQERFRMFTSQGWKDLIEDLREMEKATNRISGVTQETLAFKQGELSIIQWLLSLEEISTKAHEELNADL